MKIEVKTKNEDGDILFEGHLNRAEVGFLLQYSINDLIMQGVQFNLQDPDDNDDDPPLRLKFPERNDLN